MAEGPYAQWQAALAEGRFLLQRSRLSGEAVFPPRWTAPGSGTDDLEWIEAGGGGTLYSITWIAPRPPAEPYNVALVALDEGPHLMTRITGVDQASATIGMRVTARLADDGDIRLIEFTPTGSA